MKVKLSQIGPVKPREINECGGLATPAWCPLLPTRRTIGTCADCADSEPAFAGEKSAGVIHAGLVFCNSDTAIRDAVDDNNAIPSTFGCIYWREKGKS